MINNCGDDEIEDEYKKSLRNVAEICKNLSERPPKTFHEAIQSLWFIFTILHWNQMHLHSLQERDGSVFIPLLIKKILKKVSYLNKTH